MKPTVIAPNQAHAQAQASAGGNGGPGNVSGINIPINREYVSGAHGSPHQQQPHPQFNSSTLPGYGSPRQRPPHQQQHPQQQVPTNQQQQHFQPTFGFEPDMDMDMDNMFPRSRLGRMHHDPFAGFADSHFGFPQFSTMGRRGRMAGGANNHMDNDDDFFNRLPSEFRQYIPDGFGARRGQGPATGAVPPQQPQPQQQFVPQQYYQQDYPVPPQQQQYVPVASQQQQVPQSPSKRLCDAAIQTEDPAGRSEVDCAAPVNLNQHGLRNTVDMGVKSVAEQDQAARSHSAPPPEQQQQNLLYQQQQRPTPPPGVHQPQFGTQTSPPVQGQYQQPQQPQQHPPQFKSYYAPHQQTHPQQKQQTPPPAPQTPGGSFVRTIPIFVEGRTEPIINAHKEIPNQNAPPSAQAQAQAQAHASAQAQAHFSPQQSRPTPLNTQQQQQQQAAEQQFPADGAAGLPPQTPHTLDSINKIQDIQRDVLDLMTKVEQFKGMRQEKEYAYLDEMLTRNLLKLDTIDTNGKDSIRLARKEAIKCIQASINVLEAKAEENARLAAGVEAGAPQLTEQAATEAATELQEPLTPQPQDATKIQEPIPLPPPPSAVEGLTSNTALEAPPAAAEAAQTVSSTETTTSTSE
ncbi:BAG domain-containing protein Samui isoform X2 [Drosophila obscura]|uniref:BAG domain-containing protein Samui isoform X2 n=1 Tax=Drosophila obscura TaxID=7282 RepID=UPI001BB15302|nr:BAG domain-containing protein Samui isoform X2 [Drosophila obscura]